MKQLHRLLLVPKLDIHNANALSSSYTIGFPAMTAWMGAMHNLQRQLHQAGYDNVVFTSLAVSCHSMETKVFKERWYQDGALCLPKKTPILEGSKKLSDHPFIPEARCDLSVSLAIEYQVKGHMDEAEFRQTVDALIAGKLKIAGGDILSVKPSRLMEVKTEEEFTRFKNQLMPGHCLVERRDLMIEAMNQGQDALDAMLDSQALHYECEQTDEGKVIWHKAKRKQSGWIVPISIGYQGISELGFAKHQRDETTPHRFAENVVTLGEFKMPFRFQNWLKCAGNTTPI
ncbi:type I-F CRISPR-associated protein Csy2 [Thiomicrorhabdus sp.]|uniref:type I-F CRISPR-associated protein Csy2 n=1 Tax=Thiomicrorhabdus sp. TaxID=2039724 RepID=UPI0029C9766F|nr:type I-F CRISPR-associated protein Csy2 [Thiomicrorhabdus sp.]